MKNDIVKCCSLVFDSNKADYVNSANNHSDSIFRNVNFRILLGDDFELNAKYNLSVSSIITNKTTTTNMASGNLNAY